MSPAQDAPSLTLKPSPRLMTASALNIASIAPAAQSGAGANAAAAGGLAGFEALLGALFPQADPNAVVAPAVGQTLPAQPLPATPGVPVSPELLLDGAAPDAGKDAADPAMIVEAAPTEGQPTAGDAAAALAASLIATQPATVETQITTSKAPDANANAPAAFGRDKPKGVPAQPALLHANPHARLAEKAELAPEAADAATPAVEAPVADAAPVAPPAAQTAGKAAPPPAAAPAPAPTTPTVQAAPIQDAQPDAVLATAAAAAETPVEAPASDAPAPAVVTSLLKAAEPTATAAPVPTTRTTKSERAKAATDTSTMASDDLKPLEAADKPVHGKPVQGAAKAAAPAIDAAQPKAEEARVEPDASDVAVQGESRAASQSAAPAAHTAAPVRGSPETVANLAAQILKKLEGKSTRFDVQLDPHGLGKVDVRIEIGAQGRITAGMTFDNPQAAADVKARAAELQRALEQAGFDISGGISFDVADDRGQQQQQNQAWQDQGDASRAFRGQAFRAALETAGDAADAANQGALRLRRGVNAGLDVRI